MAREKLFTVSVSGHAPHIVAEIKNKDLTGYGETAAEALHDLADRLDQFLAEQEEE